MYRREDLIIGEQKFGWTRYIPSTSIRIGGIPFERSYRVWCPSREIIELDRLMLNGRKSNSADARDSAALHHSRLNEALRSVWIQCLEGSFDVSGKPNSASLEARRHFIPTETLKTIWPLGESIELPHNKPGPYVDLELSGPAPPWVKLTIDEHYDLPEFLVPEFQASDNYTNVIIRGFEFELGPVAAAIVRRLHQASGDLPGWCYGSELQAEANCQEIPDVFKRHRHWRELIERVARGRYRLNLKNNGFAQTPKTPYYGQLD